MFCLPAAVVTKQPPTLPDEGQHKHMFKLGHQILFT